MTVIVAVSAGMLGSFGIFTIDSGVDNASSTSTESANLKGHIVLVVKDSEGNIKEYQQTDNIVTAAGKECVMEKLWGVATACPASIGTFTGIALSSATFAEVASTANEIAVSAIEGLLSGNGFDRTQGGVTNSVDPTGLTNGIVTVSHTFTAGIAQSVVSAALFETTGSTVFAAKAFDSTVDLASSDTLTVTWNITVG